MFKHLRMNLAYKKILGQITKVLGIEKTLPPSTPGKFPNYPGKILRAYLIVLIVSDERNIEQQFVKVGW